MTAVVSLASFPGHTSTLGNETVVKKPLNKGQYECSCCVLCREVVLFSEVQNALKQQGNQLFETLNSVLYREIYVPVSEGPLSEVLLYIKIHSNAHMPMVQ